MIKKRRPGSDVFPEYSRKQPSGTLMTVEARAIF